MTREISRDPYLVSPCLWNVKILTPNSRNKKTPPHECYMKSKFYTSWPITNANFFSFEKMKIDIQHNSAFFFPLPKHTVGCGMTVSVWSFILVDYIFCWIFGVIYMKFTQMLNFWILRSIVSWLEHWNVQKSTITFFSRNTVGRKRNETRQKEKKYL